MKIRTLTLIGLSIAALLITHNAAQAQSAQCGDRAAVADRLLDVYGESPVGRGLGSDNSLVEVYASPESGSWTITVTRAGGQTCLVAAGQSWTALEAPAPGDPA